MNAFTYVVVVSTRTLNGILCVCYPCVFVEILVKHLKPTLHMPQKKLFHVLIATYLYFCVTSLLLQMTNVCLKQSAVYNYKATNMCNQTGTQ